MRPPIPLHPCPQIPDTRCGASEQENHAQEVGEIKLTVAAHDSPRARRMAARALATESYSSLVSGLRSSPASDMSLVSHSNAAIRETCDRVLWMDQGRLVMDGPTEEVVSAYEATVRKPAAKPAAPPATQPAPAPAPEPAAAPPLWP